MNSIEKLDSDTVVRLLTSINKQFRVVTKDGCTTEDYRTDMFDLYNNIIINLIKNKDFFMKEHRFTENMDYNGWCIYLLNLELEKRGVETPKFKSHSEILIDANEKLHPFTPFDIKEAFKFSNLIKNKKND